MAIKYQNLCKIIMLAASQIAGGDAAARETALAATDISAHLDGVEIPYAALKIHVLAIEKELAEMVGNSNNALARAQMAIQSDTVTSGFVVPTANNAGVPFVGSFDGVFDATDHKILTEMPAQVVQRRVANANAFFKIPAYHFAYTGSRVIHTRTGVYFRGVGWRYSTQETAFGASGESPLPQNLEALFACKVLAMLPQEQWFVEEAAYFRSFAAEKQAEIVEGKYQLLSLPQMPNRSASVNPAKD
ncbi:MAG TPA: hypothetical protein VIL74_09050 [Pyrinomonadaceae bacterium]|jgi:hypothetical protein